MWHKRLLLRPLSDFCERGKPADWKKHWGQAVKRRYGFIEVKAGTKGQMQSLHLFLKERNLEKGLRVSQENFADYGRLQTVPMYAAGNILRTDYFK